MFRFKPQSLFLKCLLLGLLLTSVSFTTSTKDSKHDPLSISDTFTEQEHQEFKKNVESFSFQAEVSRLMDIIINSLYTQKEVFLRELVSNSADALEKARFLAVSNQDYLKEYPDLEILIAADKDAKTLTIQDSGVGMTKQDLVSNLGTVARSGTSNFLEAMAHGAADVNLIGQFGVGFYSAFLVADRVTVTTKNSADPIQHIWESTVNSSFTVAADPRGNTLGRGTRVMLHLKDDSTEFLDEEKLKSTIIKFNQFVNFPIKLRVDKIVNVEAESSEVEKQDEQKDKDSITVEDNAADKEKKTPTTRVEQVWEVINQQKPLWLRPKEDIKPTEYDEFYTSLTHDTKPPLSYSLFTGEGEVEFKSIIYIPGDSPRDAWNSYFSAKQDAIKLYARRVLVSDSHYDLLPKWMSFIKGVVDSDDLPLKVDRESLSQTKVMKVISKKLVAKFIELLKKLSKEDKIAIEEYEAKKEDSESNDTVFKMPETKYQTFWKNYHKNMKIGCVEDDVNRNKIAKFLRFHTLSTGTSKTLSLDDYVKNMPEDQKSIYYIANDNYDAATVSPYIQIFKKKNYDVLILMDPMDEGCVTRMRNYESKPIVSIEKTNAKLDASEDEKKVQKRISKAYKPLTDAWSKQLKGRVAGVRVSSNLVEDPVVIVTTTFGHSAFGERVIRSQSFSTGTVNDSWNRFLDINPHHPLIKKLLVLATEAPDDPQFEQLTGTLYEAALLSSGFAIENPAPLSRQMFKFLEREAGVASDAVVEDFIPPEQDDEDETTDQSADQFNADGSDFGMDFDNFPPMTTSETPHMEDVDEDQLKDLPKEDDSSGILRDEL